MLLRIGVISMVCALSLTAGVVAALLTHGSGDEPVTVKSAVVEPAIVEPAVARGAPEDTTAAPDSPAPQEPEPRPAAEPVSEPVSEPSPEPRPSPAPEPSSEPAPRPETEARPEPMPASPSVAGDEWREAEPEEIERIREPRHFDLVPGAAMSLTIDAIGIHNVPVFDEESQAAMEKGVIHVPETPMPWSAASEKNVYLAGHRLGYVGSPSRLLFYNLDALSEGDELILKDRDGARYRYEVSESFVADPLDTWVVEPVQGRDIVTLQTCTGPSYSERLIVRADRVQEAVGF